MRRAAPRMRRPLRVARLVSPGGRPCPHQRAAHRCLRPEPAVSHRYDCRAQATFELQDQITARLVSAIVPQLEAREHQRLKAEPAGEPDAYALTLAGVRSLRQWTRPGIDRALRLFHQAITTDREFAPAYAMSSYCHVQKQSYGWVSDSVRERAEGAALARAARNWARQCSDPHPSSPRDFVLGNDVDGGAVLAERALKLKSTARRCLVRERLDR